MILGKVVFDVTPKEQVDKGKRDDWTLSKWKTFGLSYLPPRKCKENIHIDLKYL